MTKLAHFVEAPRALKKRRVGKHRSIASRSKFVAVAKADLEDALEDTRLNAIADERRDGPFVSVSLDDL